MPDWIKSLVYKGLTPVVQPIVQSLMKSSSAQVTELPTMMQYGYPFNGGQKKKYMGVVDFETLRGFSVAYDVARACINHRKRQINNLEWAITPVDEHVDADTLKKPIEEITAFFMSPANGHDFYTWTDKIMEDLLVLDAAVLWKDKTFGKKLVELLPVDGSTIRIKVGEDGTLPEPPDAAYQQIIYGELKGEYSIDEMYYKLMNPRTNTPYGLSPLECLVIGVDAALKSQLYNASLLSEGSVPEGFFGVPESWTPAQIKDYQAWFDTMIAGNTMYQSRIKFMPGGKGVGYMPTKKPEDMKFLEFEKWLLFKTCAIFDVQPRDIGFEQNAQPGNAEQQTQAGNQRGLVPTANFLKRFFTEIVQKDFGRTDLKFEWRGLQVVDNDFELELSKAMVSMGAKTINEWRSQQGMDPLKEENADKPFLIGLGTPTLLEKVGEEPEPEEGGGGPFGQGGKPAKDEDEDELEEMQKWERKCINHVKAGRGIPTFKAEHIDRSVVKLIETQLMLAKSKEDVRTAFAPFMEDAQRRVLTKRAVKVSHDISKFKREKYDTAGSRA